jgi:hypothetical protein
VHSRWLAKAHSLALRLNSSFVRDLNLSCGEVVVHTR